MSDRIWKLYLHTSPNGKKYYGITSKNNPSERWGNNGDNYKRHPYFYNAIKKYGWDNFKHEIIFDNLTENEAKLLEQLYITLYSTNVKENGYNMTLGGEGSLGYKHTKEAKDKMRKAHKGKTLSEEHKKHIGESSKTKWQNADFRDKVLSSRKGYKHAESTKQAIGKSNSKKVKCIDTGEIFDSIKDAAIKYNRNYTNLGRAIKNNKKFAGYYWEYVEEVIQLARKKKETELSPEEERRLEITKKLNKEQKLFCYHFIVEDKSMKDAYKAAYP